MLRIITCANSKAKNAGPKAKEDIISILKLKYKDELVIKTIYEDNNLSKVKKVFYLLKKMFVILKNSLNKDTLIIQYPMANKYELLSLFPKKRTIVVIHDLIGLRFNNQKKNNKEIKQLKKFSYIIAHNDYMKEYLVNSGIDAPKIHKIELFDYLVENTEVAKSKERKDGIAFAGNLCKEKSPFLHQLDEKKMKFNLCLYGVGIDSDINSKMKYNGAYNPDELPLAIDCKAGLVWDGNFDESDEKYVYKNYTKYNNPHKLSCYIAAGIPVIVWSKSAIAKFVLDNNIGYVINNIYDINSIDFNDYEEKKKNIEVLCKKVRKGYYTTTVFEEILNHKNK